MHKTSAQLLRTFDSGGMGDTDVQTSGPSSAAISGLVCLTATRSPHSQTRRNTQSSASYAGEVCVGVKVASRYRQRSLPATDVYKTLDLGIYGARKDSNPTRLLDANFKSPK